MIPRPVPRRAIAVVLALGLLLSGCAGENGLAGGWSEAHGPCAPGLGGVLATTGLGVVTILAVPFYVMKDVFEFFSGPLPWDTDEQ